MELKPRWLGFESLVRSRSGGIVGILSIITRALDNREEPPKIFNLHQLRGCVYHLLIYFLRCRGRGITSCRKATITLVTIIALSAVIRLTIVGISQLPMSSKKLSGAARYILGLTIQVQMLVNLQLKLKRN